MPENKTSRINLTVTDKQYEEWREFAEKSGLTLPAFIRFCVSSYVKAVKKFQNSESDGTK